MAKRRERKSGKAQGGRSARGPTRQSEKDTGGGGKLFYLILGLVVIAGVAFLLLADRDGEDIATAPLPAWLDQVEADPEAGVVLGSEDAPVQIMEFADYQCPYCARFGTFTGRLIKQNYVRERELARWVMYDFPLGFPNSLSSSLAARCAGEQGGFWPMHDLLLSRQTEWGPSESPVRVFSGYAGELGLDRAAFRACIEERRHLEEIIASRRYGEELGVQGTPSIFLNGRQLDLATETSYESLEQLILAAADSARRAESEAAGP